MVSENQPISKCPQSDPKTKVMNAALFGISDGNQVIRFDRAKSYLCDFASNKMQEIGEANTKINITNNILNDFQETRKTSNDEETHQTNIDIPDYDKKELLFDNEKEIRRNETKSFVGEEFREASRGACITIAYLTIFAAIVFFTLSVLVIQSNYQSRHQIEQTDHRFWFKSREPIMPIRPFED